MGNDLEYKFEVLPLYRLHRTLGRRYTIYVHAVSYDLWTFIGYYLLPTAG